MSKTRQKFDHLSSDTNGAVSPCPFAKCQFGKSWSFTRTLFLYNFTTLIHNESWECFLTCKQPLGSGTMLTIGYEAFQTEQTRRNGIPFPSFLLFPPCVLVRKILQPCFAEIETGFFAVLSAMATDRDCFGDWAFEADPDDAQRKTNIS